jgi:hypothetical protein
LFEEGDLDDESEASDVDENDLSDDDDPGSAMTVDDI